MTRHLRRLVALTALILATFPFPPAAAACHSASFVPDEYKIDEKEDTVVVAVQNPGGVPGDRSVDYETVNGTAKSGSDYTKKSGTLTFNPGHTSEVIEIPIKDDSADENNETFQVRLKAKPSSCITEASIGPPATVTIQDDDEKPIVQPTPTKTSPKPSTASASPSPTLTSPSPTSSAIAAADSGDGGLSGGAIVGIVAATVVLGGAAAFWVRRRFLT